MSSKQLDVGTMLATKSAVHANFPKPGVTFVDLMPVFGDPSAMAVLLDALDVLAPPHTYDSIGAIESRGYLIGTHLMARHRKPMFAIRKKGPKVYDPIVSAAADTEYSTGDVLTIARASVPLVQGRVLIVDDVFATGGSARAAITCVVAAAAAAAPAPGAAAAAAAAGSPTPTPTPTATATTTATVDVPRVVAVLAVQAALPLPTSGWDVPVLCVKLWDGSLHPKLRLVPHVPDPAVTSLIRQSNADRYTTLVYAPASMSELGTSLVERMRPSARLALVKHGRFPDGYYDNEFEHRSAMAGKHIVFVLDMSDVGGVQEQVLVLNALNHTPIGKMSVVIPYYAPGTMERMAVGNQMVTAESFLHVIMGQLTRSPTLYIVDMHARATEFQGIADRGVVSNVSAMQLLRRNLVHDKTLIVFPDGGAASRFRYEFTGWASVSCTKRRGTGTNASARTIVLEGSIPEDVDTIVIVDDLCHSGGTLVECARAVRATGFAGRLSMYVTHLVCEGGSYVQLLRVFDHVFTTNTVPATTRVVKARWPDRVTVFDVCNVLAPLLASSSIRVDAGAPTRVVRAAVGTTSRRKLDGVYLNLLEAGCIPQVFGVTGIHSGVNQQPFGTEETMRGARTRCQQVADVVNSGATGIPIDLCVGIESGLEDCTDVTMSAVCAPATPGAVKCSSVDGCDMPAKFVDTRHRAVSAGQRYAAAFGCDPDEWYYVETDGAMCRQRIVADLNLIGTS